MTHYEIRQSVEAPPPAYYAEPTPVIVYQQVGNCPACRAGFLQLEISVLGILCCIIFFPLGIICLFLLQEQRCSNCGFTTS